MRSRRVLTCLLIVVAATSPAWAQAAAKPPATTAEKLKQVIPDVRLANMPFMRVLTHYGDLSGLKIEADWTGLEVAGIRKDTPVTLKAFKLPFQKLLDLTLDTIARRNRPLAWYESGGVIHVTSQMRAVLRNRLSTPFVAADSRTPTPKPLGGVRQITFTETPLRMAIEFFRDITGVNFHVNWRALESVGVTRDTPITLNVRGVSVARALDLVLDQLNVGRDRLSSIYWLIEGGIVQIATGEAFNRTTRVRIYDVGDLLMVVPNFKAPRVDLQRTGTGNNTSGNNTLNWGNDNNDDDDDDTEEESVSEQREKLRQTLIEMIRLSIGEEMWEPTGKGSIKFLRDKLIISQTPLGFKLLEQAVSR